tara:strand:+ start:284 stop:1450 length:1167 start_codon:yes stop_codon:yes gene_type:complete
MISYGKQSIDKTDIEVLIDAIKSDWLTQGPSIENFENKLNAYFGSNYACALANGTAALHLTGLALGWKKNDIVITTPNTFLATSNCILYSGATPDFADINSSTYTIDSNLVEEKIKFHRENGNNIKAIIAVDYAGHPCDWNSLREIADRYELQLINDNCHALGSSYLGTKQYAIKYADVITQSYHPVKHITTGEGGAVLTNDKGLFEKIMSMRSHGITKDQENLKDSHGPWYYEMKTLGYNYRITDFQCALGANQIKRLDQFIEKRLDIANSYNNYFNKYDELIIPYVRQNSKHSYHLYPLQINFKQLDIDKKEFFRKARDLGLNLQVHYIPIHLQPFYMNQFGFKKGDFPISEEFYENVVSLPIFPDLSTNDQNYITETILRQLRLE